MSNTTYRSDSEEIGATSRPKYQSVEGVPGLVVGENPLYVPQDLVDTLSEPPDMFIDGMAPAASAIWDSGDANDVTILKETTDVPQLYQIQVLRTICTRCEADMSDLGSEIQRVHQDIIDLTQRLARLSTKHILKENLARACISIMSPLRRLPPETLGEIFLHCMPSHGRPGVSEAPLLLAHVCSAWRKAAFGFPLLWTNLSLTTPELPPRNTTSQSLAHIIRLWFNCAKNSPLTFKFRNNYDSDRGLADRSIIDAINLYTGQFRKLYLSSASIHDILGFLTLPPGRVNMLESLQIKIEDFYELDDTKITAFDNAPLLRELTLDMDIDPLHILAISWKKLTRISTVEGFALRQYNMLSILCECKQLVSCSFKINTGMDENRLDYRFRDDSPVVLKHLVDFSVVLSNSPLDVPRRVLAFNKLSCPALTDFVVEDVPGANWRLSDILLERFIRGAPVLQNLTLVGFQSTHTDLLSVLHSTLCLTSLKISLDFVESGYPPLMEALTYVQGQADVYVPSLRRLDISILATFDQFQHAVPEFMAMVRSRQITNTCVDDAMGKNIPPLVEFLWTTLRLYGSDIANTSSQLDVLRGADYDGVIKLYLYDDEDDDEDNEDEDEDTDEEDDDDDDDDDDVEDELMYPHQ